MTTKTVFQTDRAGHYIGATEADESPLEPGVFLLPAGCVETPPMDGEWPADKWPRWNGAYWELVSLPAVKAQPDALTKLQQFLAANPDVAALLQQGANPRLQR